MLGSHFASKDDQHAQSTLGVAVVLFVMWVLGFALHMTVGGLIHVLLVLAIVTVLLRIIMDDG